jgi:hypothetical protein
MEFSSSLSANMSRKSRINNILGHLTPIVSVSLTVGNCIHLAHLATGPNVSGITQKKNSVAAYDRRIFLCLLQRSSSDVRDSMEPTRSPQWTNDGIGHDLSCKDYFDYEALYAVPASG